MGKTRFSSGARRTALCGILIGLSTLTQYLSTFVPSAQLAVTALAGLFPVVAVIAAGRGAGYLCWGGSSVLALILCPDKWLVLTYFVFFGLYPVVKSRLEQTKNVVIEWVLKFVYFNGVLAASLWLLRGVFFSALPANLQSMPLVLLACNAVFLVYDIGLSRLIALYSARIADALGLK
ncbi:MAG: hypothetical protein E7440_04215 [Ruminococcaceae bacterium]|nr:hypothetical protein [Oscillospiraceae bacterium]